MIDITVLIEGIVRVLFAVVGVFIVRYLNERCNNETQEIVIELVKIAVAAAQQLFPGSGNGAAKKEYVVNWLKERKIKFDVDRIDAMIEAEVFNLKEGLNK